MPNWCYNQMTITGDKETLDTIERNHIKLHDPRPEENDHTLVSAILDFETIIPLHTEEADHIASERAGYPVMGEGTWEARVEGWGTKWQPEPSTFRRVSPTEIFMEFDSAWSPPTGIYARLAALYPTVTIDTYAEEGGSDFMVEAVWSQGLMVKSKEWHYHLEDSDDDEVEFDEDCPVCQAEKGVSPPMNEYDPDCPICVELKALGLA